MREKYTFKLSLQEAQIMVAGIKKLPMEVVEVLVRELDNQFVAQVNEDNAAIDAAQKAKETIPEVSNTTVPATNE